MSSHNGEKTDPYNYFGLKEKPENLGEYLAAFWHKFLMSTHEMQSHILAMVELDNRTQTQFIQDFQVLVNESKHPSHLMKYCSLYNHLYLINCPLYSDYLKAQTSCESNTNK